MFALQFHKHLLLNPIDAMCVGRIQPGAPVFALPAEQWR
ncbi:hypothetical protein ACS15_2752 [Ralstonia insidiosa]|uniref:Uncharacterized protein n=1 Tax=Ralstonia insidiosa TaxID=190721 RepID=A0AAC9BHH7_9RALS|nr:hypothetical protein ACS15_2752 [Ralstonia insidiosa]